MEVCNQSIEVVSGNYHQPTIVEEVEKDLKKKENEEKSENVSKEIIDVEQKDKEEQKLSEINNQVPTQTEGKKEEEASYEDSSSNLKENTKLVDEKKEVQLEDINLDIEQQKLYSKYRPGLFAQMQTRLQLQHDKCTHYEKMFEHQNNTAMASQFEAHVISTAKYLEILETARQEKGWLPKHTYEPINFTCLPYNPEIREKEVQLTVRTQKLPSDAQVYIVAEFEFDHRPGATVTESIARWLRYISIDSKNLCYCTKSGNCQYDKVEMEDMIPFDDLTTEYKQYTRPIIFHVDKGKSRTLKRKFKPIKLMFYQRRGPFRYDRKLGQVLVKIDSINDDSNIFTKLPIMNGRKETGGIAEVQVKVREPLVNKTPRLHEEKILMVV